jgi:hypothetical protein
VYCAAAQSELLKAVLAALGLAVWWCARGSASAEAAQRRTERSVEATIVRVGGNERKDRRASERGWVPRERSRRGLWRARGPQWRHARVAGSAPALGCRCAEVQIRSPGPVGEYYPRDASSYRHRDEVCTHFTSSSRTLAHSGHRARA